MSRLKSVALAASIISIMTPQGAFADQQGLQAKTDRLPKPLVAGILPNGLRYIVARTDQAPGKIDAGLVVDVGSATPPRADNELAHLIEHIAITYHSGADGKRGSFINFLYQQGLNFGSHVVAITDWDRTSYKFHGVPSAQMPVVLRHMREISGGFTFTHAEFETQRRIIAAEVFHPVTGFAVTPGDDEFFKRTGDRSIAPDSRFRTASIKGLTFAKAKRFYADWYRPELQTIIIRGDIDPGQIEQQIGKLFGNIQKSEVAVSPPPIPPIDQPFLWIGAASADKVTTSIRLGVTPSSDRVVGDLATKSTTATIRWAARQVLSWRLNPVESNADLPYGGLELRESITKNFSPDDLYLKFWSLPEQQMDAVAFVASKLGDLRRNGASEAEIERLRVLIASHFENNDFSAFITEYLNGARLGRMGERVPETPQPDRKFADELTKTNLDVELVRLTNPKKLSAVVEGPTASASLIGSERVFLEAVAKGFTPKASLPQAPSIDSSKVRMTTEETGEGTKLSFVESGISIILKPDSEQTGASISAEFDKGIANLPPGLALKSATVSKLIEASGIGHLDHVQFGKALADAGIERRIIFRSFGSGSSIYLSSASGDADALVNLLAFHLAAVPVTPDAPRRLRTERLSAQFGPSANMQFSRAIEYYLATGMPFPPTAFPDILAMPNNPEIDAIWKNQFGDFANLRIELTGAFSKDAAIAAARRYLGQLRSHPEAYENSSIGSYQPGKFTYPLKNGITASVEMRFIGSLEALADKGVSSGMVSQILRNRIFNRLREKEGHAYAPSADIEAGSPSTPPYLGVHFSCDPAQVDHMIAAARDELVKIQRDGFTTEEIAKMQRDAGVAKDASPSSDARLADALALVRAFPTERLATFVLMPDR